jgi:hypothetical protein
MNTENPDQADGTDPLDTLLREQLEYVEDRGFTARVIQSLPGRKPDFLRVIVLLSASAIAVIMAIFWLPWDSLKPLDSSDFLSQNSETLGAWLLVYAVLLSLAWTVINALRGEGDLF